MAGYSAKTERGNALRPRPDVLLEDVERYLVSNVKATFGDANGGRFAGWLRDRFAELRAREEAKSTSARNPKNTARWPPASERE